LLATVLAMSSAQATAARDVAPQPPAVAAPGLVFERVEHDFGAVRQGDPVAAEFAFENRGPVPLTLSPPVAGCDCEAAIVGSADLSPGEGGWIRFSCDTSRRAGSVRLTATVHSSEVERRAHLLTMRGEVSLDVVAEPAEVYLGRVLRGDRKAGAFSVRAGGTGKLRTAIRGAATEGPYIDVAPAGGGRFDVTIRPGAPLGTFTQDVAVATSSERLSVLTVPVTGIVVEELPARRW
jgi:hypothetical protein